MNSNQNSPNEINLSQSNKIPMKNQNILMPQKNENSPQFQSINSLNLAKSAKQVKIQEDNNCSIIENKINNLPFDSVSNDNNQINSDKKLPHTPLNKIISESFPKELNLIENSMEKKENKNNLVQKNSEIFSKRNRSQLCRNSMNGFPYEANKILNEINNGVIKVKLFKSQIKQKRTTINDRIKSEINIFSLEDASINEDKNEETSKNIDLKDKKEKYKLLIKRIALQLNRNIKPPTKGYFYGTIIQTDKYLKKIKKIAKNMKNPIHSPTHGFFYSYIEKGKNYKLLIKRIASQLKKRIKFPKCKIIKIYESYRVLVKRIADSLKNSIISKNKLIKENSSNNMDNQSKSNDSPNDNLKNTKYENNEDDKMDIIEIENNEIANVEIKKNEEEIINENNILNSSKYENSYETNKDIINSFSFSKMNNNQEEILKSARINKESNLNLESIEHNEKIGTEEIEQFGVVEQNAKDSPLDLANICQIEELNENKEKDKIVLNEEAKQNESEKIVEIKPEINNCINNSNVIDLDKELKKNEKCKINENRQIIRDSKYMRSVPCLSKQNKEIYLNLPMFKKENCLKEEERKIQNRSHKKNNINLNLNNFNYSNNIPNNNGPQEKINFSDLNASNPNFNDSFKKFLIQEKIDIIDIFPLLQNENAIIYFQQSNFWYMLFHYLFCQNINFSLYSIIHLLEQYNIWAKDKNEKTFLMIKEIITKFIMSHFSQETITQFLFMNKFKDLNQIFDKFEINKRLDEYKEIKIDNINIINNDENIECKCNLCTDEMACIQKICNINKNKIIIDNDIEKFNLNGQNPEVLKKIMKENLIKETNRNNVFHINEGLFFKGIIDKKKNCQFSKSKIIVDSNTNLEYNCESISNKKKSIDKSVEINDTDSKDKSNDNKDKDTNINEENVKEKENIDKDNLIQENDNIEKEKNNSKIKEEEIQNQNLENTENNEKNEKDELEKLTQEKDNQNKNEEEENNKEKEEEKKEEDNESKKINKNEKKNMKVKSRKRNKKKKDLSKLLKDKIEEEDEENEEEKTEESIKSEEKSIKKRKKSGNSFNKKKNKNKAYAKSENDENSELEEILKEDKIEEEKSYDEENYSNKKVKKSKSPNKKKNKKH